MQATSTVSSAASLPLSKRIAAALSAALLGLVIIYGVGFVPIQAVHNAAHDSRHSAAFPCH